MDTLEQLQARLDEAKALAAQAAYELRYAKREARKRSSLPPVFAEAGSLHDVLGVASHASPAEIKAAYLRLARAWHPDAAGGDQAVFQRIAAAYQQLQDAHLSSPRVTAA